jgi:FixJ family two-component response regulator
MPGISGTKFLAECRGRYPGIGGIFVTGNATVECAVRALRAGALDLLQKPVDKETLIKAVDRALMESQLAREQRYFRH